MNLLVIGGSGRVGTGTLPFLAENHDITVFDVNPPKVEGVGYIEGSVLDTDGLAAAVEGREGLIFMAMAPDHSPIDLCIEVNALGVYNTLEAAANEGLKHVVHTSTVTVHHQGHGNYLDESLPLDNRGIYGLTKGMGERACQFFADSRNLSVIALRLYAPSPHDVWQSQCGGEKNSGFTTFRDTARAYDAALSLTSHEGFDAVFISGDHTGEYVNCAKARELLGWEPLDRCE